MGSVISRIEEIHQPVGGYLPMRSFSIKQLDDSQTLNLSENISPNLIGMAVDYLTRFTMGASADQAFSISLRGARIIGETRRAKYLLSNIHGLDPTSILSACQLVGYDVCYRAGRSEYKPTDQISPDEKTIENIRIMVQRGITFWSFYGPIVKDSFTFDGAYTFLVSNGDGDYLTADTIWDFKTSKKGPKSKHSLQLLMYYIMGLRSINPEFQSVKNLGIFNPRLNKVYICPISSVSNEVIQLVSHDIIGYDWTDEEIGIYQSLRKKAEKDQFDENDYVFHSKYGYGTITTVQTGSKESFATVIFKSGQTWFINTCFLDHAMQTSTGNIII